MNIKLWLGVAAITSVILVSCDDTTNEIGVSLTDNVDHLEVSTSTFYARTRSVPVKSVVARSTQGYLGRIKDPETGAYITGDFMTQFYCMEGYTLSSIDSVASLDAQGKIIADSCEVRLFYTSYYGDSLATMKLTLYEMERPMPENLQYYTDFSPLEQGYVREDGIRKSHTYSLINNGDAEREVDEEYVNNICVKLNDPYTDRNGVTYNNFGTYILRSFYEHPEYFKNANAFRHNLLPGFFFKMSGGLGAMAYISVPQLNIYYRLVNKNGPVSRMTLFNGTEEILQTTTVTNDEEAISQLVENNSCTYIKSPAGIYTEVTLPVDEIVKGHENDTINTARIVFNRINNETLSVYNLSAPSTLLMLETDSLTSFFEKGKVANYKQSFLGTYSSSANSYTFGNIGGLITAMYTAKTEGLRKDPQWVEKHPNWNKAMLVPVTTTSTTVNYSTIITGVANDMKLTSTRLVGGDTPILINVIYSKFN